MSSRTKAASGGLFRMACLGVVLLVGCVPSPFGGDGPLLVLLVVGLAAALIGFYFHKRLEEMEARLMVAIRRNSADRAQGE